MWKNISSYSKSEDRSEVKTTQLKTGRLDIKVTKHIHFGDELIMVCGALGIANRPLGTSDMEEAQAKALDVVEALLKEGLSDIEQARSLMSAQGQAISNAEACAAEAGLHGDHKALEDHLQDAFPADRKVAAKRARTKSPEEETRARNAVAGERPGWIE